MVWNTFKTWILSFIYYISFIITVKLNFKKNQGFEHYDGNHDVPGFLSYRANSENPIRPHVNFGPQNDPLIAIQAKWAPERRVMGSPGLLVLNYQILDWTVSFLWPWENWKFPHSLTWGNFGVPQFHVHRISNDMGFVLVNRYLNKHAY